MEAIAKIEIKEIPELHIAAVLSTGVQNVETAFGKLISWAISKHLFPKQNTKMITVYLDSFKTTPPDEVKMLASMLLEEPKESEGEILHHTLPSGKYIVGSYFISTNEFQIAWKKLFQWMNDNGYQFRKTPVFEIYHNNFKEHPERKCNVDFYIPIVEG